MVNIKRVGAGILGALFVTMNAEAGLPTFDAANISGTVSIVKNGSENLKGISDITNKVGELNTIVGDAAASVSKFQEQYGDEINKGMELAKKAMARKAEAEAAKAAHDAEVQAQKDAYQAALDSAAAERESREGVNESYEEPVEEVVEEDVAAETEVTGTAADEFTEEEYEEIEAPSSAMSSANRVYNDEVDVETGGENLDGIAGDEEVVPTADMQESEDNVRAGIGAEATERLDAAVAQNTAAPEKVSPVMRKEFGRPAVLQVNQAAVSTGSTNVQMPTTSENVELKAAAPAAVKAETPMTVPTTVAPVQRRQFRTAPRLNRVEKVSYNTYYHHETMVFASASDDGEAVGNSYVGDVYIVPMAQRCEISAQTFINDEKKRNECVERIVRENNADNSFDSNLSMKDCRKMIYNAVIALMAEATNSKYEAANYSDTLDEQDKLAADSTDVRGDLTVIAMSNYQTQLLLNRISMNFSSQIILETAEQLCAARKDVLGDSDLTEESETSGGK